MKNFKEKCVAFLPDQLDTQVYGEISFNEETGIVIHLEDTFQRKGIKRTSVDIILCMSTFEKKYYTLIDCRQWSFESQNENQKCAYTATYCIEDLRFDDKSELLFGSLEIEVKNLNEWLNRDLGNFSNGLKSIFIPNGSTSLNCKVNPDFNINFHSDYSSKWTPNNWSINRYSSINFEYKRATHLDKIINDFKHFKKLLDILMFRRTTTLEANLGICEETGKSSNYRFYYSQPPFLQKYPEYDSLFFLSFEDISNDMEEYLQKWFSLKDILLPVTELVSQFFIKNGESKSNDYLNSIQALEVFHRIFRKNNVLEKDDFNKKKNQIIESVPPEHKDFIKELVQYANEPRLKDRLDELLNEFANWEFIQIMIPELKLFVTEVRNTRNYYTHFNPKISKKALSGNKLIQLTDKVKILVIALLLKELDFKMDILEIKLRRITRFIFQMY